VRRRNPGFDRSPDSHSAIESTGFRSLDEGQRLEFDTEPARETQVDDVRAI
jgi:cold shock CspA family protein